MQVSSRKLPKPLLPLLLLAAVFAAPAPAAPRDRQTAVFAGGCFWCTEAVFEQLEGVVKVVSGYTGGTQATAHYEIVGSGKTDHAESIEITFDPDRITYARLLEVFFLVAHDPTQLNRQGPDWGRQYRSAIFYKGDEQKRIAEEYIQKLEQERHFKSKIVTEVTRLTSFYPAEDYHQDYVKHHPDNPYVVTNSLPKLRKLRQTFPALLKK
ncbi:MAG: peptide-methionine (S)-S-oxide reductase MsrA [Candidatus Solibacter usitatus]|nr:peptide-methionine (S)-S-oxide reductase MsrA [Candidatus Solibacter usitatus]